MTMFTSKRATSFAFAALLGLSGLEGLALATEPAPVADKAEKTGINWDVQPAEVVIFLDDRRLGEAGKLKFTETKPGKHNVKLMLGKDETEADVTVKKGQTLKFTFSFDQG